MNVVIDAGKLAYGEESVVVAFVRINDKPSGTLLFWSTEEADQFLQVLELGFEEDFAHKHTVTVHRG